VAGLGLGIGVYQYKNLAIKGLIAWFMHRGYHGLAMPSWERKWRVLGDWWLDFWLGRDNVSLAAVQNPRGVFEEFAARPKPQVEAASPKNDAAPAAAKKPAAKKEPAKASVAS
jgi:NADH dehydrogenase